MDYIIKVKHNRYPGDFQVFCRITDNKNHEEVIGEMCNVLTLSEFCDCTFVYEDVPSEIKANETQSLCKTCEYKTSCQEDKWNDEDFIVSKCDIYEKE